MKKPLMLRDGERLCDWCKRLAEHYGGRPLEAAELQEVLREVSIESYTHGSNDAIKVIDNRHRAIR